VRGQLVRLGPAWLALREHGDYPAVVRRLLGEAVAAAVLLASTLKFEGELTLQVQGGGPVRLLVAQCSHDFRVRAVARFSREHPAMLAAATDFPTLVGDGNVVVTLEADRRAARYQGIVPVSGGSLGASLEHYFAHSEQLPTGILLGADDFAAGGMLVQRMPGQGGDEAAADRTFAAAREVLAGVSADELLVRPPAQLMRRAFDGLDLRLHDTQAVDFRCRCSALRVGGMLRSLGEAEVRAILLEQGAVTVTCEFCHKPWLFDAVDVSRLFAAAIDQAPGSRTVN